MTKRSAVLGDASYQQRAHLKGLADFLRIIFLTFEFKDRAARHYFEIRKLRERADQAFGETIAEIFVVGVRGGVHEGQHSNRANLFIIAGAAAQEVRSGG